MSAPLPLAPTDAELHPARFVLETWTPSKFGTTKPSCPVVTLREGEMSMRDALGVLASAGISSAPMIDETRAIFKGFFSPVVVLTAMLNAHAAHLLGSALASPAAMQTALDSGTLDKCDFGCDSPTLAQPVRGSETSTGSAADGDIVWEGFADTTFLDLISHGLQAAKSHPSDFQPSHRIAIYSDVTAEGGAEGGTERFQGGEEHSCLKITDIVSQSDVLDCLMRDEMRLGDFPARRTVGQLFPEQRPVAVPASMLAIGGFALMLNAGLSGIPIVNAEGQVLSELDVRMLERLWSGGNPETGASLCTDTCQAFALAAGAAEAQARSAAGQRQSERLCRVLTVSPSDSLLHLMRALAEARGRRVYVVDSRRRLIRVVTLSDVLRIFSVDPDADRESWLTF